MGLSANQSGSDDSACERGVDCPERRPDSKPDMCAGSACMSSMDQAAADPDRGLWPASSVPATACVSSAVGDNGGLMWLQEAEGERTWLWLGWWLYSWS